jgi:ferritin
MTSLINESLKAALCEQIGHEFYNANLYMYMCAFLRNKGLDNLAKHFESQHEEEIGHGKEFVSLLTDLNADVFIPEIDGVNKEFNFIIVLAQAYLDREILTTRSINEILKLAIQTDNPVVEQKMREMIAKQQKEYEEATTFLDNAILCGDDWWKVKVWSDSIGG